MTSRYGIARSAAAPEDPVLSDAKWAQVGVPDRHPSHAQVIVCRGEPGPVYHPFSDIDPPPTAFAVSVVAHEVIPRFFRFDQKGKPGAIGLWHGPVGYWLLPCSEPAARAWEGGAQR
jgi:hypothetical protein